MKFSLHIGSCTELAEHCPALGSCARASGRFVSRCVLVASFVLGLAFISGCGTTATSSSTPPPAPATVSVSVQPTTASIFLGQSQTFTASVTGTSWATITWAVNGVAGGNAALGTIAATNANSATYVAPQILPAAPNITIAASISSPSSASGSANVTIQSDVAIAISPTSAGVPTNSTQLFVATVSGSGNPSPNVTWSVNGVAGGDATSGTIAATSADSATFTAPAAIPLPANVTVTATSVADPSKSASATVNITSAAPPPVVVTIAPLSTSIPAGQRANFSASVTRASDSSVTWAVNGVANGNSTVGEVCAPFSDPCASPTGTESSVDFLAPMTVPQPSNVTLTATSVASPSRSASAQISITPASQLSVAPFYAFLAPSQQFHFIANVAGGVNQAVLWSVASAVAGQGCSGNACGSIDNSGNYTSPTAAPSPNAISILATSEANPSVSASATVALTSGPVIERLLPSSVVAGPQQNFLLAVQGLNFIPSGSGASQLLFNGIPRTTSCATAQNCTIVLQSADVAAAASSTVQIENPGPPVQLSNPVPLVVVPAGTPPAAISLTSASPIAFGANITVTEETTAGATSSPINVDFAGPVSPDGSACTIGASPISVTRPTSGSATINICVHGNFLDPTFAYSFSSPGTGNDIVVAASSMAGLFSNLIELTLTISSNTAPGVRSLFITTPNGDTAVATGILQVQ